MNQMCHNLFRMTSITLFLLSVKVKSKMVHQLGCFCLHIVTYSFLNNKESYYLINICYIVLASAAHIIYAILCTVRQTLTNLKKLKSY